MKYLQELQYTNREMHQKQNEFRALLELHNTIRYLVDHIKNDEILHEFYQQVLKSTKCEYYSGETGKFEFEEPEVYLLCKTVYSMGEYIKNMREAKNHE